MSNIANWPTSERPRERLFAHGAAALTDAELIAVVLGAPSGRQRAETAARLLEHGFNSGNPLAWLIPAGTVDGLQAIAASPPNLREEICGKGRGRHRTDHAEEEEKGTGPGVNATNIFNSLTAFTNVSSAGVTAGEQASLLGNLTESMPPIAVTVIPPKGSSANAEALHDLGVRMSEAVATASARDRQLGAHHRQELGRTRRARAVMAELQDVRMADSAAQRSLRFALDVSGEQERVCAVRHA